MRHANISTTMNLYGGAFMKAKRKANTSVVSRRQNAAPNLAEDLQPRFGECLPRARRLGISPGEV
jgi:hypothetical protein